MSLDLDFDIDPDEDFWGYHVDDLQSTMSVSNDDIISGELKYIADYSSAFGPGLDEGNYMVAHFTAGAPDATITVELDQQQVLDPDGLIVLRIRDKDSQTLKVVASADGQDTVTKYYSLSGLTCLTNTGQG